MSEGQPRSSVDVVESAPDPTLGRTIAGKFAVQQRLGAGAMGVVYLARQLALDKVVAIKVLHRQLAVDGAFTERFRREARAASRLDHPNSIRVFDFGQEPDGLLYLAMEYVDGPDLFSVLSERGPLPPEAIVDLLCQVLAALAVAHDLGVLHRDLKPENIMIVRGKGDDGLPVDIVKVCDFGIAKIVDQSPDPSEDGARRHTTRGLVVGTPAYMSPEQARGGALDGRSDLYTVGVILYELLTGQVPFDGGSPLDVVLKHISEAPSPPSFHTPAVDPRLEAICMKALSKEPADRFQDAREMRLALRSALGLAPVGSDRGSAGLLPSADARVEPRQHDVNKATLEGLTPAHTVAPRRSRAWLVTALMAPAAGALLFMGLRRGDRAAPPSSVPTASHAELAPTAVAPPAPPVGPAPSAASLVIVSPAPRPVDGVTARDHEKTPRRPRLEVAPSVPAEPAPSPPTQTAANELAALAIEAPAPVAPAPPATTATPSTPAPPVEPPAPAYDLASARVEIGQAVGTVGVTSTSVSRAMSEASAQLTGCYRSALPRLAGPIEGRGMLHLETDGSGIITSARLSAPMDAVVARCVASAIQGRRVANVDTGSASAEVPLLFKAH
jgi:eukaryotic-like serine/threonine-protein kinase